MNKKFNKTQLKNLSSVSSEMTKNLQEIQRILDPFQESSRKMHGEIKRILAPYEKTLEELRKISSLFHKLFERHIQVSPSVYEFLLEMNLALSEEELEKALKEGKYKEEEIFTVGSLYVGSSGPETITFKVTKKMAKAIQILISNKVQYTFPMGEKLYFDDDRLELIVNGIPMTIKKHSARYDLCKYMFVKDEIPSYWEKEDLVKALNDSQILKMKDSKKSKIIHGKIRRLNEDIEKRIGYSKFIILQDNAFVINTPYLFLLKD
jgi:hypothetical protein